MISRHNKVARYAWIITYLFFTLAGILALYSPSQVIITALVKILVYTWCIFLIVGGGSCLGGKIAGNWVGEIIGLPLLAAANYVFGVLVLVNGNTAASFAFGGILCGIGTAFLSRWIELRGLAKANQGVNSDR